MTPTQTPEEFFAKWMADYGHVSHKFNTNDIAAAFRAGYQAYADHVLATYRDQFGVRDEAGVCSTGGKFGSCRDGRDDALCADCERSTLGSVVRDEAGARCPKCESDQPEVRKLVQLPGDEYCPNQQWDKCTDNWHEVLSKLFLSWQFENGSAFDDVRKREKIAYEAGWQARSTLGSAGVEGQKDLEYIHLPFCNGSRKVPPGTKGVTCSCELISRKELHELRGGWISVDERLPERGKHVLVVEDGNVTMNYIPYAIRDGEPVMRFAHGHDYITHWRPLPPAPKGNEEKEGI